MSDPTTRTVLATLVGTSFLIGITFAAIDLWRDIGVSPVVQTLMLAALALTVTAELMRYARGDEDDA